MKFNYIILLMIIFLSSTASGSEPDNASMNISQEKIITSIKQMTKTGIEQSDAVRVTNAMQKRGFSQENILNAHKLMIEAAQKGLPVTPIMNKAYEGMSKNIQSNRIVHAMERVLARYDFAEKQARNFTSDNKHKNHMTGIIADTLSAGMSFKDTSSIVDNLHRRTGKMKEDRTFELATETFKAARELARVGVSSGAVRDVTNQAVNHGYNAQDMQTMRHSFLNHSGYMSPDSLAESYSMGISHGMHADNLGEMSGMNDSNNGMQEHGGGHSNSDHGGGGHGGRGHGGGMH